MVADDLCRSSKLCTKKLLVATYFLWNWHIESYIIGKYLFLTSKEDKTDGKLFRR